MRNQWFVCGVVLLCLAGCRGAPAKPTLSPVRGTVTYKGKPVTQGEISFEPIDKTIRRCSSGIKDGAFDMWTMAGTTKPDGAMPGTFKVVVLGSVGTGKDAQPVPQRFADAGTTPKTVEIKSGGDTNLTIDLQ
jgi:hypothetical protein